MSRVIKFRAWSSVDKIMLCNDVVAPSFGIILGSENHDVMQFTGLTDKNGVEIYEGDIVRWGHIDGFEECLPRVAVVEFSPGLTFRTINLKENHQFRFGNFAYRNTNQAVEVIGNVCQNPELLNQ